MSLIKKAQAAVNIVSDLTASLKEQKAALETKIAEKNDAIKKLLDMPMSFDDFCSFIHDYVRREGEKFYSRLSYENRERNLVRWGEIENENGDIDTGHFYIRDSGGTLFGDASIAAFSRECFFHPENTIRRLTEKLKADLAESWGNEQFPSVEERREAIKALQAERDQTQAELDEVNANINGILSAANIMVSTNTTTKD
ncbi:hypothetical protein OPZ14_004746 [Salmonella enterica subsp. enterica]|nr:hypothetical protein [Salmonella enterica subsp. enterica]EKC4151678.1 hypothetical protein [Salmonella enterica subsp. enterica]